MAMIQSSGHEHWSSRFTFIMAAIGSAVGLGNFWRFPYEAGKNGGGAFVLVYLICVLLVALPLVAAELAVGRRGGLSAVASTRKVARDEGKSGAWSVIGWNGMIASMIVLSFYSVIAGWIISYIPKAFAGAFHDLNATTSGTMFGDLLANVPQLILGHFLFIGLTTFIVIRGLKHGIEAAVSILMPIFFILLVGLMIFAAFIGDFKAGWDFMFTFDMSKITGGVIISALGQAFFSVGVGVGIMLTYGAYLNKDVNLRQSATIIALSDTMVAIIAGLLIFPLVFGFGLNEAAGPGLLFVTLPIAFGQMGFGAVLGGLFFLLALVAAITSSISMLEIFTSWAEEHAGLTRHGGALLGGGIAFGLGLGTVLSFNLWSGWHPLDMFPKFVNMTFFDLIDFVSGKIMLPLGGLLVAVFVGWVMSRKSVEDEIINSDTFAFRLWFFLVKWLAPVAVAGILVYESGLWEVIAG